MIRVHGTSYCRNDSCETVNHEFSDTFDWLNEYAITHILVIFFFLSAIHDKHSYIFHVRFHFVL